MMDKNIRTPFFRKVTLSSPTTKEELYRILFQALWLCGFGVRDDIYLLIASKRDGTSLRLFFCNHSDWSHEEYILVGKYKYCNFFSPLDSALAFSETIAKKIKILDVVEGHFQYCASWDEALKIKI
ncbi:MAG: hypothetical protein QG567_2048 [Campylobacterota bacterium]|nr:hypothetical protein [Campylobacterota bacterium]